MVRLLSNQQLAKQLVDFCSRPNIRLRGNESNNTVQSRVSPYHYFEKQGRCMKAYDFRKRGGITKAKKKKQCPPKD